MEVLVVLQCGARELRGAGRVLSVLRTSAAERHRQMQVQGGRWGLGRFRNSKSPTVIFGVVGFMGKLFP